MDMTARLEALAAAPKPFAAVLTYSDGTIERVGQPRRLQAERIVERYSAKIGRPFRLFDGAATRFATLESVRFEESR